MIPPCRILNCAGGCFVSIGSGDGRRHTFGVSTGKVLPQVLKLGLDAVVDSIAQGGVTRNE